MTAGVAREISLGEGFGDVAVKVNGAAVEIHSDGSIVAHTSADVDAYTNASVRVHPANERFRSESSVPDREYELVRSVGMLMYTEAARVFVREG